jgi:hypothetical protein
MSLWGVSTAGSRHPSNLPLNPFTPGQATWWVHALERCSPSWLGIPRTPNSLVCEKEESDIHQRYEQEKERLCSSRSGAALGERDKRREPS